MAGVRQLLTAAWTQASARQASLLAAGVAFYAFLALFPAMIAGLLVYSLVVSPTTLSRHVSAVSEALPRDAASVVTGQMESLAATSSSSLGLGLVVAISLALYSASGGIGNLVTAVNVMFGRPETRGFVRRKLLALGLTAGALTFFVVTIALVAVAPPLLDSFVELPGLRFGLEALRWSLLVGALVLGIGVLFRVAPDRGEAPAPALISRGVVLAAAAWLVVSVGFSLYVDGFGSYGKTYGTLAGVVALLLWLWAGLYAILLGAAVEAIREECPTETISAPDDPNATSRSAATADQPDEPRPAPTP